MSNFDSGPLICDHAPFLVKNYQTRAKSNRIFPGKLREDRALILQYLHNPLVEFCPENI